MPRPVIRPVALGGLALSIAAGGLAGGVLAAPASAAPDAAHATVRAAAQAAPPAASETAPDFGPNVMLLDPSMSVDDINARLASIANEGEFSTGRHAVLFQPGTYGSAAGQDDPANATGIVNADVGYYTTVSGAGSQPGDVTINGALHVEPVQGSATAPWTANDPGSLTRFWRGMSNLAINPIQRPVGDDAGRQNPEGVTDAHQLRWAVSQAAPLRRVDIRGSLTLFGRYGAFASGGYLADSRVAGTVVSGSQQQWFTRDSSIGGWDGGVWNMVFSGVQGAPGASWPADGHNAGGTQPLTVEQTTPVTRGAPFVRVVDGRWSIFAPKARTDAAGASWGTSDADGRSIPFSQVFLARPSDSVDTVNAALDAGLNVVLTPGVYSYDRPLEVTKAGTVVLGMGMATLVPTAGNAAIETADVPGVQLSGITVDAGAQNSDVLVRVGPRGASSGDAGDPTTLSDVFVRIGGPHPGRATTSIEVNSPRTLLDDIWAWRADHGDGVGWTQNTADTGVVVNGADETATGLFVEHYQRGQVVWNGERGRTVFYQSEMPYDVPDQGSWNDGGTNGWASYRVADGVQQHSATGLGVYSYFRDATVSAENAIQTPSRSGVAIHHAVTRFLNGHGEITHVWNGQGDAARSGNGEETSYLGGR